MNIRSLFLLSLFAACTTTDEVGEVHQQSSDWGIELQTTKVSLVSDLESTCGPNAQPDPYCMATCTEGGSTDVCLKKCGCVPLETTDAFEEVAIGESTISESSVYRAANVLALQTARARVTYVKIIGPDRQIIGPDHEIIGPDYQLLAWIELDGKLGHREHVARLRKALAEQTAKYGSVGVELYSRH